ncbi:MAG: 30S ribosomal protein S2 [Candidatus Njordarchaeota archaeon]
MSEEGLLIPASMYMKFGVHIGTHSLADPMRKFVHGKKTGVYLIDIKKTDERIRVAAKMLADFEPDQIFGFAMRLYAQKPLLMMAKWTGIVARIGKYYAGILTNPSLPQYTEPEVVFISDPIKEANIVREANMVGVPVVSLADTSNEPYNVDLVIPCNNRGRKALALVYWLISNQVLREKGMLGPDERIEDPVESFMVFL